MNLEKTFNALLAEFERAAAQADTRGDNAAICKLREALRKDEKPPVAGMLRLADCLTEHLLWLAQNRPDMVKPHAAKRFSWPAQVALYEGHEKPYRELLGKFNKAGKRIEPSPISLGNDLPFRFNRRTDSDLFAAIAGRAARRLLLPAWRDEWTAICLETMPDYVEWVESARRPAVAGWLDSLGPLNKRTWLRWKPVFERYFTVSFGPIKHRVWLVSDARSQSLNDVDKPRIYNRTDIPEVRELCAGCTTEKQRWGKVKHKLMKKCKSMLSDFERT